MERNWRRIGLEPKPCKRWCGSPEQTMIKIVAADQVSDHEIRLRFSDDSFGVYDFSVFLNAGTPMTEPLRDPTFSRSHFLALGALAWPNGFDLSAASLQQRLHEAGAPRRSSEAASRVQDSLPAPSFNANSNTISPGSHPAQ